MFGVGGADQRVVAFIGYGEDDAVVVILEDVGLVVGKLARNDDVAAAHQADIAGIVLPEHLVQYRVDPGACRIHDNAGGDGLPGAVARVLRLDAPLAIGALRAHNPGVRLHAGTSLRSVQCIEDDQPGILDPAV